MQTLHLISFKADAVWKTPAAHRELDLTVWRRRPLKASSFRFEKLVEWARLDEGTVFATGHRHKYKSAWGADGCCRVWENTEGPHMRPHLHHCSFPMSVCPQGLEDRPEQSHFKADTQRSHPVSLWSDTAAQEKSKHSHSLRPLFQLHPNCWEAFKLHVMSVTLSQSFGNAHGWWKVLFISF